MYKVKAYNPSLGRSHCAYVGTKDECLYWCRSAPPCAVYVRYSINRI